ncbi:MAG: hypothetical protein CMD27_00125 [Flavobacteriales bacterium]|jgi:protein SCO1/2|nr:hypothetical protein [Flavobacteriales bacterium]
MTSIKKWLVLFSILIFPYIIVQIVEKSTHNILTLGYIENTNLDLDSVGDVIELVDSLKVPTFKLINQDEEIITNKDLLGVNYIVNFFFTSCPTICPTTTLNLIELQNKINKYEINNFKILSISVDPVNDTPKKLKEYASSMNIDLSNWEFLTGSQQEIYDLVKSGFSLSVGQDSLSPGGVFHSPSITIIDDKGYLRTGIDKKKNTKFVYDGTLYSDIKLLVGEIQRLSITNFKDNYEITKQ